MEKRDIMTVEEVTTLYHRIEKGWNALHRMGELKLTLWSEENRIDRCGENLMQHIEKWNDQLANVFIVDDTGLRFRGPLVIRTLDGGGAVLKSS